MKSKITIELDFDKNIPYIRFLTNKVSDDVRDKIAKYFFEKLGHTSSWCKIEWPSLTGFQEDENIMHIYPVTPQELREQAEIMLSQAKLIEKHLQQASISH